MTAVSPQRSTEFEFKGSFAASEKVRRQVKPATLVDLPLLRRLADTLHGIARNQVLLITDASTGFRYRFERAVKTDFDRVVTVGI